MPSRIYERLDGPTGLRYIVHVKEQLEKVLEEPAHHGISAADIKAWDEFKAQETAKNKEAEAAKAAVESRKKEALAKADKAKAAAESKKADEEIAKIKAVSVSAIAVDLT